MNRNSSHPQRGVRDLVGRLASVLAAATLISACGGGDPEEPADASRKVQPLHVRQDGLSVIALVPTSVSKLGNDVFEIAFKPVVRNPGDTPESNLTVTAVEAPQGVEVVDGSASVSYIRPRGVASTQDVVRLRMPKNALLKSAAVRWTVSRPVNGIAVPAMPDVVLNKASVAGIDTNSDGIRDDIEIRLATVFGAVPEQYAVARLHAKALQAALTTPGETTSAGYTNAIRCAPVDMLKILSESTVDTLDTKERRRAYVRAMAGAEIEVNQENCS